MQEGYRALELIIGPFATWEGQKTEAGAISILSTGSADTFKIRANINKSINSVTTLSTISIYNLKQDTINRLSTQGLRVKLLAGYENGNMEVLYVGAIKAVTSEKVSTDMITQLWCIPSANNIKTQYSKTYSAGTKISSVIRDIASTIPGIIIDPTMIDVPGTIGKAGWSYMGDANSALNRLAFQFGFSWTIDGEVFYAFPDGKGRNTGIVLDETTGLKKVSPQLFGLFSFQKGLDVESMYVQGIHPFNKYEINSKIVPTARGQYLVHTVQYDLCPKTDQWTMSISFLDFSLQGTIHG